MKKISEIQHFKEFDSLEFIARQVVEGFITGLHRSPFHGFSVEFAEHRLYNTGESTKHIDWKLFARTEKLFVKRYEEETNLRSQIIIDVSSSMLFPVDDKDNASKLTFSVVCTAALIHLLRKQRDAVGLSLFSDQLELHTPARMSIAHSKMLNAQLEKLLLQGSTPNQKKTHASTLIHQIADNIHKRSLVVIFSDMMDNENPKELLSALQHLRYNKHEVILFHVTDKKRERQFDFHNRPYKFVDLETGEEVKFNPNDVRESYTKNMEAFYEDIKLKCGQYSIDFVEADINEDFKAVLLPYLIKRGKLY